MNKKKKILVIDDNEVAREVTKEIIQTILNYNVITASSGKEGLKLFKKENPELVISDFMMPGWNGHETAKEIEKISPLTPVIIATGYMDTLENCPDNIISIMSKPFTVEDLRDAIEKAIGKP